MNNQGTYNALKQMQKGTIRFNRLKLVCKKLEQMGLVSTIPKRV
ncbi:hypothetical protein Mucpa_3293 [Mucilaginibacter paludis DSM 18603]|uniref:Uncharacterized protein n=1 Tax=Mucilaginibacter paludis DSM 18603 TaxID=714943 RepID=H1YGY8_9SPHI|nr:hypothetical protein Mucpa_3293 [Mucilaginibacter paludis DSM 18603]